jgi:hypothetical protein
MLSGDSSADFLALMLHSVVQPAKPAQSGDRTGWRATIARTLSTPSMSLEKVPAGAFNKAQRLIERPRYMSRSIFCKDGKADLAQLGRSGASIERLHTIRSTCSQGFID